MIAAKMGRVIFGAVGPCQGRGAYKISHSVQLQLRDLLPGHIPSIEPRIRLRTRGQTEDVNSIQVLGERG